MQQDFIDTWRQAAHTTVGLFWTAFWAFGLGYAISSMIQVFVTRARMRKTMGRAGARSVALATLFGFISSSCSFAALSTTRALFAKGAGLVPSLAFLLASTNLVIELGIVIAIFLSWQFVVGEYLGGLLLILLMWALVRLTAPRKLVNQAREQARSASMDGEDGDGVPQDTWALMRSAEGWKQVARTYVMEWQMVWKDVTIGFTVAGIIAAFVPRSFFHALFVGAGTGETSALEITAQALIGPVAAFFTFIGSMGNIPLAAVLFDHGVSFAGVIAFIFSDLVVLPVLRIQASYYGWKMALYVAGVFLVILVCSALLLHYGFAAAGLLPDGANTAAVTERDFFQLDHSTVLGLIFLLLTLASVVFRWRSSRAQQAHDQDHDGDGGGGGGGHHHHDHGSSGWTDRVLLALSLVSYAWLAAGLALRFAGA
ncbi:MAG: permease [Myxococcales bacterium]|jgi:uncharacterized membrane protein YraQ (UPF0718 family)